MKIFNRLKYAVVLSVAVLGIGIVFVAIFSPNNVDILFSEKVVYPLLLISFLVSPFLEKYIRYK